MLTPVAARERDLTVRTDKNANNFWSSSFDDTAQTSVPAERYCNFSPP